MRFPDCAVRGKASNELTSATVAPKEAITGQNWQIWQGRREGTPRQDDRIVDDEGRTTAQAARRS